MISSDLLNTARVAEAVLTIEAEQAGERERRDVLAAKAEGAVLPANFWQERWRAEQKARAARLLRTALEEALA